VICQTKKTKKPTFSLFALFKFGSQQQNKTGIMQAKIIVGNMFS
jgi:hypothetical protein